MILLKVFVLDNLDLQKVRRQCCLTRLSGRNQKQRVPLIAVEEILDPDRKWLLGCYFFSLP